MASLPVSVRDNVRDVLLSMPQVVSWKTLALLLAIINLKNLPLSWHVRLFYHCITNIRLRPDAPLFPRGKPIADTDGKPTHPVFVPYGITTRTPILETDYNLHKSNSTYFTDLDVARTALVSRLYSPGVGIVSRELDAEFRDGSKVHPGKAISIVLGSVFCSFKREVKPFEPFEIQSKLIAWDQKWAYIISFFLRPAPRKSGKKKTLLATAVSKYVVKKGRLTVSPERLLRASGFLPARPEGASAAPLAAESTDASGIGTPASGEGITAETGVDGSLVREVLKLNDEQVPGRETLEGQKKDNAGSWDSEEWPWERIEQERQRGLGVVEGYSNLDAKIHDEWKE
ncbi:hypothetical protein PHISP_05681 [Aspergillus sp. HF37]|nr:hypothetical protein PHISP_05681 [Aspergillus sp. HF37]